MAADRPGPFRSSDGGNAAEILAVSGGELAGIGLDITLAAWADRGAHTHSPFVVYTDARALEDRAGKLGRHLSITRVETLRDAVAVYPHSLPVIDVPGSVPARAGYPDSANGAAVISAIEQATAAVARGDAAALVTNPIAKHVLYDAGFRHPGHTEFLAELAAQHFSGGPYRSVMMLAADELRVVPLTIHVALSKVPALITTSGIVTTARILAAALTSDCGIANPRIAVAGLNPHAGENGTMGREDIDVIEPAIRQLASDGLAITGPHSADTMFHPEARTRYDAVIAMYHDQALIPLKTLAFDRGVNITLGLPFVRTSPDHGTAFDIAATGKASPSSFIAALQTATRMAACRLVASKQPQ